MDSCSVNSCNFGVFVGGGEFRVFPLYHFCHFAKRQYFSLNLKAGKIMLSQIKGNQAGGVPSFSASLFYSNLQLIEWSPLISRGGGWRQSTLLSLIVQMLFSSTNILIKYTQNNVWQNVWAPHGAVKLTHKINTHITESNLHSMQSLSKFQCHFLQKQKKFYRSYGISKDSIQPRKSWRRQFEDSQFLISKFTTKLQ